jgi:hypothetical protein
MRKTARSRVTRGTLAASRGWRERYERVANTHSVLDPGEFRGGPIYTSLQRKPQRCDAKRTVTAAHYVYHVKQEHAAMYIGGGAVALVLIILLLILIF